MFVISNPIQMGQLTNSLQIDHLFTKWQDLSYIFLLTAFFAFCSGFIIHDQNQASIGPGPGGLPLLVDTSETMVGSNY